jgi:hypothetical protein
MDKFDKYKVENQYQCAFQVPNADFAQLLIDIPDTKNLIVNVIGDFTYLLCFRSTIANFTKYIDLFSGKATLTMDEYLPKIIENR